VEITVKVIEKGRLVWDSSL